MKKLLASLCVAGSLLLSVPTFAEDPAAPPVAAAATPAAEQPAAATAATPAPAAVAAVPAAAPAPVGPALQVVEAKTINSGDTAWVLISTALVLFMTIPGLSLFYGGMVRKKNVLATLMQSFAITALVTVLWAVIGYSLAFTPGNPFIGGLDRVPASLA